MRRLLLRSLTRPVALPALALCLGAALSGPALAAGIKDSESASHGDEAAGYQLVQTYTHPGFRVMQFSLAVLSHYSYILASGKDALVVDPGRDVDAYLAFARKEGLTVRGVYLTHSHADFVAGHLELAKAAGCPVHVNEKSAVGYRHEPLREGSVIRVGEAEVRLLETPGHTPDGTCGLVWSQGKPRAMFSGDTLFVGSVGRPDLLEGTMSAAELAGMGFDTWTNKLSKLPDDLAVLPAHGAGSLCGAHLRDEPSTTIGQERASNPYFQHRARSTFVAAVLDGLPEAPQYFKHNAAMNRKGPELVDWKAAPKAAPADKGLTDPARNYVVDLRDAKAFAAGHVPNSVNIGLRGRLETWVGIMVPWGSNLVLCGSAAETAEAARRLHRVGYSGRALEFAAWEKAGLAQSRNEMITPAALHAALQRGDAPVVVDVRLPSEWMALRIGTVVNLPLNHLAELSAKLDPSQPVVAVCNSAYRSSMAVGILERRGFGKASSLDGGSEAWIKAGLPVFEADKLGAPAGGARKVVRLPDRLAPAELQRLIQDLPGTFDLVDIRPPEQFADYSLPGSRNADIAEVISNPAYLTGAGALIIADRDGSLAMAAGGILSQKTERQIKVLHGGVEAYWREFRFPAAAGPARSAPPAGAAPAAPPPAAAPAAPAPAQPAPAQPPKKKSAGC
ncbi:MAG TPA: rhodanese-like domain-containing protein [Planctomycetota bacterium]|nr:rhodanese-like domain-containing protein [Planctomycetota bacterium]